MTAKPQTLDFIRNSIRDIPNWPEPGVMFRDISTMLQNPQAFRAVVDIFVDRYKGIGIDVVAGLDARGFIFGPIVAYELGIGFVPIRKKGKLPYTTVSKSYTLEYGDVSTVEMHIDAVKKSDKVVVIDDLIATGGTMLAACSLITDLGAKVHECAVVSDLLYLKGSDLIKERGFEVFSILEYK
ncbi:adenine phosphoribosyltransferase [Aquella oligotrophica]|uniref:Adenine phosphoribosyltransferase n=1 Tax=Aquella oligotrophica TaxID=2067065 RepID=A0A2I7N6W4_9NEIS|nr:adenine phosphoribosyltransferase [Aquella oligotrophica]AUR52181.1 adenine phosphoribosyltransferase [Aquella oligotrophica]